MDQIIQDILCNVKEYLKKLTGDDKFYADNTHHHNLSDIDDYDCRHNNDCHTETYATETYTNNKIDTAKSTLQTKIDQKSKVTFSSTLSSGTKIGEIKIDSNPKIPIYCEHNTDTVYTHPNSHSTNMIKDPNAHNNIGSTAEATQSTINSKIDTALSKKSKVTFSSKLSSGTLIGNIKIDDNAVIPIYCEHNTDTIYTHPNSLTNDKSNGLYKVSVNKQGHITEAIPISKNDIMNLGITESSSPGLVTANDRTKLDSISSYSIYLNDVNTQNAPKTGLTLEVDKSQNTHAIYAHVKQNKNTVVSSGSVVFIVNGVTYVRNIGASIEDMAALNINLNSKDLSGNRMQYTVIAMYIDNGYTAAVDIKSMLIFDNTSEKYTYNNNNKDIIHN